MYSRATNVILTMISLKPCRLPKMSMTLHALHMRETPSAPGDGEAAR